VPLRCLLVDDSAQFLGVASKLLERGGLTVVGLASTSAEALDRVRELEPDVTIVDVQLGGESGFDLAWKLAEASAGSIILMSMHGEADFAELVAVTPVLGFISKTDLSAQAVRDFVSDRAHGHGCRHEALVYSSMDELVASSVPFMRQGLAAGEDVLVVLREPGRAALQRALNGDAAQVEFRDAVGWYRSPEHAFQGYIHYLDDRFGRGAPRVRVVAEVIWPRSSATTEIAGWKRYEAQVSVAMAAVPVSFVCAYSVKELPATIVADAHRTHPVMRTAEGARSSPRYEEPGTFVRGLERDAPGLSAQSEP
jgi:two-component system, NarL family, nitrate/nitrite response regulator NarL